LEFNVADVEVAAACVVHAIDTGLAAGRDGARYSKSPSSERAHGNGGNDAGGAKKGNGEPAAEGTVEAADDAE
jgi:hypothetical protein